MQMSATLPKNSMHDAKSASFVTYVVLDKKQLGFISRKYFNGIFSKILN